MSLDDEEVFSASWEEDSSPGVPPEPEEVHGRAPMLAYAGTICGFGLSALIASTTRWMLLGPNHGLVAVIAGTVAGAALGFGLDRAVRSRVEAWVGRAIVLPFLIAPPVAAVVTLATDPEEPAMVIPALLLAIVVATVAAPIVYVVCDHARRARRSRVSSVVGGSDRNAPYRAVAASLSGLAAVSAIANLLFNREDEAILRGAHLYAGYTLAAPIDVVALVAAFLGIAVAVADARARKVIERSSEVAKRCRVDRVTASPRDVLDLGVGDDVHVERADSTTYRIASEAKVALLGDVDRGLAMVRDANHRSVRVAGFGTFALVVVAVGHVLYVSL